jgi:hypothetical protein
MNLLPTVSHIAGITDIKYHAWLICGDRDVTFYPGWLEIVILPNSASQVAGITGLSHHTRLIL